MRIRFSLLIVLHLIVSTIVVSGVTTVRDRPTYKQTYKPSGGEATIVGSISLVGTAPAPKRIDMSADPDCYTVNPNPQTESVVVTDGKLANVVVYLQGESLNVYSFELPSEVVTLEHKGCRYVPHVLGIRVNQVLRIINSDPTPQNTHPSPRKNVEWNQSQAPGSEAIEKRFAWPELFIPIKDNQHPWKKAYLGVFAHPFFSVTSIDGTYKISGLPPGQYKLVAWHETFGEQIVDVTVSASEQKTLDFSFKSDY